MSKKPINLTAHKSNIERTRRKAIKSDMQRAVSGISSSGNIVAYSIVALADDGQAYSAWDTGGVVPMWAFPETAARILRADLEQSGIEDDFKRPLINSAWKGSK